MNTNLKTLLLINLLVNLYFSILIVFFHVDIVHKTVQLGYVLFRIFPKMAHMRGFFENHPINL